jgi:hypothetical protein
MHDHALDQAGAGKRLMSGSSEPQSKTRLGALQDTHERLGSLRTRLSFLILLVAMNIVLTASVLWLLVRIALKTGTLG